MRGRRINGERGSAWRTATDGQRSAWLKRIRAKCQSRHCSLFKSRPSSCCDYCGNDPVPVGTEPYDFDRANGWDWF